MGRRLGNWLKGLHQFVEETESPRDFWLWSGIFTICSALQRRVWLPYGLETIYPNIFILIVAPPARCRKAGPPSLARKFLKEIKIPVSPDSTSKRALTKDLAQLSKERHIFYNNRQLPNASMAIVSREMSSLLATDPKGMIEALTDLYDSHDEWDHKTSTQGGDPIRGCCVSTIIATTPKWISSNLPEESIGGGFTSRFVIVNGRKKYKLVPRPPIPDDRIFQALIHDLRLISGMLGEFSMEQESMDIFDSWYNTIEDRIPSVDDDRLHPFMGRMHVIALKVAMAISASHTNSMIISPKDITTAITLIDGILDTAGGALGGFGASRLGPITDKIKQQIMEGGQCSQQELLRWNYRDLNTGDFDTIIDTLTKMGCIEIVVDSKAQNHYRWRKQ